MEISREVSGVLQTTSCSRTESLRLVERAGMMPCHAGGEIISSIARSLQTNRRQVSAGISALRRLVKTIAGAMLSGLARFADPWPMQILHRPDKLESRGFEADTV